jgi:hypothetical protein
VQKCPLAHFFPQLILALTLHQGWCYVMVTTTWAEMYQ